MPKPALSTFPEFYHGYVARVKEEDLLSAFDQYPAQFMNFLKEIPDEKWTYRYAPGKWSIGELVQHVIDAERIFSYRALRFARKDQTELPGFDENLFAENSKAERRSKNELLTELHAVQKASLELFRSFDEEQLESVGIANGKSISVNAIGFVILGHPLHHQNILQERYL